MTQQKNVEERSLEAVKSSMAFIIKTNEQNLVAADRLKGVQLLQKEVGETFDPIIEKAHKTHKEAIAQKNKFAQPLRQAEITYKGKIATFCSEQEKIRAKEEAKLRREAEEKERKLKEKAEEALKKGDEKKAEKLMEKAEEIPIPVVAPKYEKPSNISFSMRYRAEITDIKAIPRYMNGIELLVPDMPAINRLARGSKGTIKIPGIRIIAEKEVSGRTA